MLGLLMKKEYILDVLNKRTSFDARLYDSDVRGKIGLIESGTNKLYGYVNMVDVHQITYEDYVKWHISDNYDLDLVALKLQNNNMIKRNAYAYDFENQVLLSHLQLLILVTLVKFGLNSILTIQTKASFKKAYFKEWVYERNSYSRYL